MFERTCFLEVELLAFLASAKQILAFKACLAFLAYLAYLAFLAFLAFPFMALFAYHPSLDFVPSLDFGPSNPSCSCLAFLALAVNQIVLEWLVQKRERGE